MAGDRLLIDPSDLVVDFLGRSSLVEDDVERAAKQWTVRVSAWVEPDAVQDFHLEGEGIRWADDATVEVDDGATV